MCVGISFPIFGRQLLGSRQWPPRPTLLGASQLCNSLDFNNQSQWGLMSGVNMRYFLKNPVRVLIANWPRLKTSFTSSKENYPVKQNLSNNRSEPYLLLNQNQNLSVVHDKVELWNNYKSTEQDYARQYMPQLHLSSSMHTSINLPTASSSY